MSEDFAFFMERRVQEKHRPIVTAFRDLMKRVAPEATERMRGGTEAYYSVPVYRVKRDIVAISPSKSAVTFSFTKGASFNDSDGVLTGTGKASRTVVVKRIEEFPEEALTDFIRQAVEKDMASS